MEALQRVQNPQVSSTIPAELHQKIVEMAENDTRTVSQMVAILLAAAVKERERHVLKRKRAKENNS